MEPFNEDNQLCAEGLTLESLFQTHLGGWLDLLNKTQLSLLLEALKRDRTLHLIISTNYLNFWEYIADH